VTLFPFADYWWFYAGFTILIFVLLVIDLGVFHRKSHTITMREAARWSVFWIALSLLFNAAFLFYAQHALANDARLLAIPDFNPGEAARQVALEFLAGYVVEYTLSVDNMFVFVVVFSFFRVPGPLQHRVLFYGILGALMFRGLFIALGSILLAYHWVVVAFGVMLIVTGIRMVRHDAADVDPGRNLLVRFTQRLLPITGEFHGKHFFVRLHDRWHATPLFLALAAIELSDVVFAIDSVPAIFALTSEPLVVYTSNVFAILGLRSLYFVLAGAVVRFSLLKYGLAGVLVFIGLKMIWLNQLFDGKFPIAWSLAIIVSLVGGSIVASLAVDRAAPVPKSPIDERS
jgi:tellurite resistance protein TerC